jgi:chorismate mutase
MSLRGIRGAITIDEDRPESILKAARQLLEAIMEANPGLQPEDLGSVIFTVTDDLTAAYPAEAARQIGWTQVPLLCTREIPVPGGLPRCIRILLHWNTDHIQEQIRHIYLGEAASLRPDLRT